MGIRQGIGSSSWSVSRCLRVAEVVAGPFLRCSIRSVLRRGTEVFSSECRDQTVSSVSGHDRTGHDRWPYYIQNAISSPLVQVHAPPYMS